jgi:hypothetical protein
MACGNRAGPRRRRSWNFLSHKQIEEAAMAKPNPERQIHRACGDIRAALFEALELLSKTTVPGAGCDDMFRAFSDLGRVQSRVAAALHATNLLDQMVGLPEEQRPPWSHYRTRINKKSLYVLNSADGYQCFARRASAS